MNFQTFDEFTRRTWRDRLWDLFHCNKPVRLRFEMMGRPTGHSVEVACERLRFHPGKCGVD